MVGGLGWVGCLVVGSSVLVSVVLGGSLDKVCVCLVGGWDLGVGLSARVCALPRFHLRIVLGHDGALDGPSAPPMSRTSD